MPALTATQVTITMPREAFDQAREVFKTIGQAFDVAAEKVKADEKTATAGKKGDELMAKIQDGLGGGQAAGGDAGPLAGFGQELSAKSNSGMGMPPMG